MDKNFKKHSEHRSQLLNGIDAVTLNGVPGPVMVFGEQAFAVLTGGSVEHPQAVVAASIVGSCRLVAIGHNGYLTAEALRDKTKRALVLNAINWTLGSASTSSSSKTRKIMIFDRNRSLVTELCNAGFDAWDLESERRDFECIVWRDNDAMPAAVLPTLEHVGIIVAVCPWGWQQIARRTRPGVSIRDDLGENDALRRFGLAFADGYVDATDKQNNSYAVEHSRPEQAHARLAMERLVTSSDDDNDDDNNNNSTRSLHLIEKLARALPHHADELRQLHARLGTPTPPSKAAPLDRRRHRTRLAVTLSLQRCEQLPPADVCALPGIDAFPGAIADDVPRIERSVFLVPSIEGWQSFGLVSVALPAITE
jgi:hypothetical protein